MGKFIYGGLNMQVLKELKDVVNPDDGTVNPDYKRELPDVTAISASWYPKGWKDFTGKDEKMWLKVNTKKALNKLIEREGGFAGDVELSDRDLDIIEYAYQTGVISITTVRNMVYGVVNSKGEKVLDPDTGEPKFKFPDIKPYSEAEAKFVIDHIEVEGDKKKPNAFESEILLAFGKKGHSKKLRESQKVRNTKPIVHAPKKSPYPERRFFGNKTPEAGDKNLDLDWDNLMKVKDIAAEIDNAIIPTKVGILTLEMEAQFGDAKYLKNNPFLAESLGVYRLNDIDFKVTKEYRFRNMVERSPEKSRQWKRQKKYVLSGHKDINPEWGEPRSRKGLEEGGQARFYRTQSVTIVSYIKRQMSKIRRWMSR